MTKKLTLQQLHDMTQIPTPTMRAWLLKANNGEVYTGNNIANFRTQLSKKLPECEKILGCKAEDVEILKNVRQHKEYVSVEDLKIGSAYILHNYSLVTEVTLRKVIELEGSKLYIFQKEDGYKTYGLDELTKPNIKFEEVEAED